MNYGRALLLGLLLTTFTVACTKDNPRPSRDSYVNLNCKKPEYLKAGDKVALISPSYYTPMENVDKTAEVLRGWGLNPVVGLNVGKVVDGRYAGTVAERVGGNLCTIAPNLGTDADATLGKDIILFIEEVEESMHNIDRQFNILAMNGVLDRCQASDALRQERAHTESLKRTIFVS